uniref:Uncharacterized protein n=1 Tax=Panagrolaimus sp. JU765 TaxID=591449 RepID=A0AC34RGQ9_9BILA
MQKLTILTIFGVFVAVAVCNFHFVDNLVELTPASKLKYLMIGQAAMGTCPNEELIKKANHDWEAYLNISTDLSWKNASTLWVTVRRMYRKSLGDFMNVCRSRDLFYQTFGQSLYYQCINIFSLMQYTTDWTTAALYARMWQHLDFMCDIGYEQLITPGVWNCVNNAPGDDLCTSAYQQQANWTNPATICPAVQNFMNCEKALFDGYCGQPIGYYACEDVRLGYGGFCENLRCLVQAANRPTTKSTP